VAALSVLLEYSLPLLREGGVLLATKGPTLPVEEAAALNALAVLGAAPAERRAFSLPDGEQRIVASYRKKSATPDKYPRRAGIPEKRPL
jgi:16S rRNA (guanine527-N7)-methyltransferase